MVETQEPGIWTKTTWLQIAYGLWVNQTNLIIGLSFGFSAVAIPQISSPGAEFSCTFDEQSWMVSVVTLTAPLGCLISGVMLDIIGRRLMLILSLLPMTIGWFYTGFAWSASSVIVGRLITGIGVGLCTGSPRTYCTEISLPNVRGVSGVMPTFSLALGFTIQGTLGKLLNWKKLCYICGSYSTLLMGLNSFLPESPYFVLMSGNMEKTKKSLSKFRAKDYNIDAELEEMRLFKIDNDICKLPLSKSFAMVFKRYSCIPFCIIVVYLIFAQLSGVSVMMFWTIEIMKASHMSIDPYVGNIIMGVVRVFAGVGAAIFIFFVPRRPAALTSALGIGWTCIAISIYIKIHQQASVIPEIGYLLFVIFASLGYYPLPLLMLFELIPLQIRGLLGGITISLSFVLMFFANKSFPFIKHAIGMANTLLVFGISSLVASVYLYIILPETKHLTLQQIEVYYKKKHSRRESAGTQDQATNTSTVETKA